MQVNILNFQKATGSRADQFGDSTWCLEVDISYNGYPEKRYAVSFIRGQAIYHSWWPQEDYVFFVNCDKIFNGFNFITKDE